MAVLRRINGISWQVPCLNHSRKMPPRLTLWIFYLAAVQVISAESSGGQQRAIHRLVGGHLNIANPDSDDTEFIITSSAGGGRDGKQKGKDDGEEKKTLSQQVADGKYGLIQKELFSEPVKRPGVISYESNPEVPKDNINNLGGLNKNDIWLAENHLLVIKGGAFPPHDFSNDNTQSAWEPIDSYKAPRRQVKIPANPKVPPPFPVQLTDNGPLQILGTNSSTTINGTFAQGAYPISAPEDGFYPAFAPLGYPYPTNITSGEAPFPIPPFPPTGDVGPPYSPVFSVNGTLPPFYPPLPPGAAILPPPGNFTEYEDDDPSIYYPPPYSFFYQMDNSTQVPPGPLVPGIVLPPPPNFFGPLEKQQRKKPVITTARPTTTTTRITTTTEPIRQIRPTTTPIPPTPIINKPIRVRPVHPAVYTTTKSPQIITIVPVRYNIQPNRTVQQRRKKPPQSITVLKPVKTSTRRPIYFYENNEVNGRPLKIYSPPRTVISSTQIPLKAYYSTSNEIDTNSVTPQPEYYTRSGISTHQVPKTTKSPSQQYYFYEEEAVTNSITTQRSPKTNNDPYYNRYYLPSKQQSYQQQHPPSPPPPPKQQYYYVTNRPSRPSRYRFIETTKKPDSFSLHVARLKQQIHEYYTTPLPYNNQNYQQQRIPSTPKPVYQFSFQAANYKPQNSFRASIDESNVQDNFRPLNNYNVQIQPAIEVIPTKQPIFQNTPPYFQQKQVTTERPAPPKYYTSHRPDYQYEDEDDRNRHTATPRPISQFSFDSTQSPVYQPYYTKQDEPYYDDITKKYFTIFGKKIPQTTPISRLEATTPKPRQQIQYSPPLVNYVRNNNRPRNNVQAEYVDQQYNNQYQPSNLDINVNYKQRRPSVVEEPEIVEAIPVKISASAEGKPGSFISYELPGDDGAHFYFLTPQLAQSREQGAGYYYSDSRRGQRNS